MADTTNEYSKRVPLATAIVNIANYKTYMANLRKPDGTAGWNPDFIPRGFTILHADLLQILGYQSEFDFQLYQHFRGYFGMEDATADNPEIKIYVVPMKTNEFGDGSDVILNLPLTEGGLPEQVVFDFNYPCPNTCDRTGILYNA